MIRAESMKNGWTLIAKGKDLLQQIKSLNGIRYCLAENCYSESYLRWDRTCQNLTGPSGRNQPEYFTSAPE